MHSLLPDEPDEPPPLLDGGAGAFHFSPVHDDDGPFAAHARFTRVGDMHAVTSV